MREDAGKSRGVVLGFDPGAVRLGWCALDIGPEVARYVGSGVIVVDLDAGDAGLAALRADLGTLLLRFHPAHVAVERVARVHGHPRMGAAYASGLALTGHVAGEVAGLAAACGFRVRTVTREQARAALGLPAAAKDAAVAVAVRARVAGWPARSTPDRRDAAAAALLLGEAPPRSAAA